LEKRVSGILLNDHHHMFELLTISFKDLLNPQFYIDNGGLWVLLFIVFAETGLMVGFFLPGDSLLFVAGIYSEKLIESMIRGGTGSTFLDLVVLWIMVSVCGIIGNAVGYWFGHKSGPYLFHRKDSLLFKKKHLYQAKEFYDKHGGQAIIFARFLPIVRTFAPIIAGIVAMDKKKFVFNNIIGCLAWVFLMLFAGHYLEEFVLTRFNFDLKKHLEVIVIGIVVLTTAPVLYKLFFGRRDHPAPNDDPYGGVKDPYAGRDPHAGVKDPHADDAKKNQ
jgi:membrane-associated protein